MGGDHEGGEVGSSAAEKEVWWRTYVVRAGRSRIAGGKEGAGTPGFRQVGEYCENW